MRDRGWLDARHHFSFADYLEPARMGWGRIRAWNDDTIQPGAGFAPHVHREMEIITLVREGVITHCHGDGSSHRIEAGRIHALSAGAGIRHSERNLESSIARAFQIWLLPDRCGGEMAWGSTAFPGSGTRGFVKLASGIPGDRSALTIRAEARVLGATLGEQETVEYGLGKGRHAYLVPISGCMTVNGVTASARDGIAIRDIPKIRVTARTDGQILLVDAG